MIRGMFLEFPRDPLAWEVSDQYMFGSEYLVAPVTEYGAREREVYLPVGRWEAMDGSGVIESKGETVTAAAPLDYMPVYRRLTELAREKKAFDRDLLQICEKR